MLMLVVNEFAVSPLLRVLHSYSPLAGSSGCIPCPAVGVICTQGVVIPQRNYWCVAVYECVSVTAVPVDVRFLAALLLSGR